MIDIQSERRIILEAIFCLFCEGIASPMASLLNSKPLCSISNNEKSTKIRHFVKDYCWAVPFWERGAIARGEKLAPQLAPAAFAGRPLRMLTTELNILAPGPF